jgi:tetratricopeptide (TPR) repeat protein
MRRKKRRRREGIPFEAAFRPRFPEAVLTGPAVRWLALSGIAAFAFLVYVQTLSFSFTYLDDNTLVLDNGAFLSDISHAVDAFRRDVFGSGSPAYRPLLTLSLMLDAQVGGTSPRAYHVSNVVWHALTTCVAAAVLLRLRYPPRAAGVGALLFGSHPALVPAVAWIPGRNDSLLTLFALLAFLSLIVWSEGRRWPVFVLHQGAFAAALFTKESALVLPLLWVLYRRWVATERPRRMEDALLAGGWLLVAAGWAIAWRTALTGAAPVAIGPDLLLHAARAFVELIGAMLVPVGLAVYPVFGVVRTLIGGAAVVLLVVLLWRSRDVARRGRLLFGAAWLALTLLPSLLLLQQSVDFDYLHHRLYLPMFGLVVIVLEFAADRGVSFEERRAARVGMAIVGGLALLTVLASRDYRDGLAFWTSAVQAAPRASDARYNLGVVHELRGERAAASVCYEEAIRLNPAHPVLSPKYHVNLGKLFEDEGRLAQAAESYQRAIALAPDFALAQNNLGAVRFKQGDLDAAESHFERAIALQPSLWLAHYSLCAMRFQQGRLEDALRSCEESLRQGGDDRVSAGLARVRQAMREHMR